MPNTPVEPTSEIASATAGELRSALLRMGFAEPGLPFVEQIAELNWVGTGNGSIWRGDGPLQQDRQRTVDAFFTLLRLKPIASMVAAAVSGDPNGTSAVLRRLKDIQAENHVCVDGQAGDHLFELEVAAALLRSVPEQIRLDDDVIFTQPDGPDLCIQCKRPEKQSTILKNVKKGLAQLAGRPGVVVVALDKMIETPWLLGAPSWSVGVDAAKGTIESILADGLREEIVGCLPAGQADEEGLHSTLLGVLFTGLFAIHVPRPDLGGHVFRQHLASTAVTRSDARLESQLLDQCIVPLITAGYDKALE